MPRGLTRYQESKNLHFITFSCYQRRPYLATPSIRDLFENSLETTRKRYRFFVTAYVVMPEPVHLLISEPESVLLATALKSLKLSVSLQTQQKPFWQRRYYDFNVFSEAKLIEKRRYIHRNPVERGLVQGPDAWIWSSFRHWLTGEEATIEIESQWTARRRSAQTQETQNAQ